MCLLPYVRFGLRVGEMREGEPGNAEVKRCGEDMNGCGGGRDSGTFLGTFKWRDSMRVISRSELHRSAWVI